MEKKELTCPECESRMTVNQTCEYEVIFRLEITALVHKISEKVKNFPHKIHYNFASMDCLNLCAAKEMSNKLIQHLMREEDPNSLLLIQQLSEKLTSKSDDDLACPGNHKICMVCGLKFKSTRVTVTHLTIRHPEYLALVQFLRRHPLSELKFEKDVVALSRTKTQELLTQIANPALATRQSFAVSNAISAEGMKKIKQVVENSSYPDKNNVAVVLVPKKCLTTSLKNSNSERHASSGKESDENATAPGTRKIIQFGVEDSKKDQLSRQQEKETIKKKEEIFRKVIAKYNEKEIKKKVLYWQKKLTRYVMQHRKLLFKLEHELTTARHSGTNNRYRDRLLEKVHFYVRSEKVKKNVTYLLKKLFKAMEKVPTVNKTNKKLSSADSSSSENSPGKVDKSPTGQIQNCSPFKGGKNKECGTASFAFKEASAFMSPSVCKLTLDSADSHTDTTLITYDRQLVACPCGKLNCLGLHPENFY